MNIVGLKRSALVLLNSLDEFGKDIECEACQAFYSFFCNCFINSIIQEQ